LGDLWDSLLNERQRLVVNRLLDGFEGKLTTMKYGKLAKCSHDTALRDIAALVERGILVRNPEGGRSTSYSLGKVSESLAAISRRQAAILSVLGSLPDVPGRTHREDAFVTAREKHPFQKAAALIVEEVFVPSVLY
jgi:hypothetical protein